MDTTVGLHEKGKPLLDAAGRDNRTWRRSLRCVAEHHCVEVARTGDGFLVRNSQCPEDELQIGSGAWQGLIGRLKDGTLNRAKERTP